MAPGEADAVIGLAAERGINLFETSYSYNKGAMVQRLGRILRDVKDAIVSIRIGIEDAPDGSRRKNFEPAFLRDVVLRCRDYLCRSRVDVVLLHNPDAWTVAHGQATGLLQQLCEEEAIGAWGVSATSTDCALASLEAGAQVLSVPYNVLYTQSINNIAAPLASRPVSVLAHSILAYGLLAGHWGPSRTFDVDDHRRERWTPEVFAARLRQCESIMKRLCPSHMTPREVAIRFVLSNTLVSTAVLGPRTTGQLLQMLREAGDGPPYLGHEALAALPALLTTIERTS